MLGYTVYWLLWFYTFLELGSSFVWKLWRLDALWFPRLSSILVMWPAAQSPGSWGQVGRWQLKLCFSLPVFSNNCNCSTAWASEFPWCLCSFLSTEWMSTAGLRDPNAWHKKLSVYSLIWKQLRGKQSRTQAPPVFLFGCRMTEIFSFLKWLQELQPLCPQSNWE